jgi:5'-methylthioadenosine phosphorylase
MISRVAVVGGSGVYAIDGLTNLRSEAVSSPFGRPSDALVFGDLDAQPLLFLPRHGRGHRLGPSKIDYRANIDALKRAGASDVLSFSAVGSLREELPPGTFVIVDQFIDRTFARDKSFFGDGCVAHVAMADPTCKRLGDALEKALAAAGIPFVRGGTYLAMEGPQFSTRAESHLYRSWGCDLIGMTNMPEAKLAREAELCYASLAMVTDFDCWRSEHADVDVAQIVATMKRNTERARDALAGVLPLLRERPDPCPHGCDRALDVALLTPPEARDPELVAKLDAVAGRVLRPTKAEGASS